MHLSIFERFWLWRRRNGLSQEGASRMLGCSRSTVQNIEYATVWPERYIPEWELPTLTSPGEEVRILRRRAGVDASQMAALLDVSRITLYRIENDSISLSPRELDDIHRAVKYHQKHGNWPDPGIGQIRK